MVSTQTLSESGKKYELVPPDGGWGYAICVAATINFVATCSFLSSFGIIFNDFFVKLGMGTADIGLMSGINALSLAISGFLAGPLLKIMSMRNLAFLASTLFNAGLVGTVFVNTKVQLIFCQGILQNLGMGILFNLSCTALNDYFKEKRLLAMSVVNTVTAAAAMVAPLVVDWTTSKFGFQGTLWMISAVGSMAFVGSALFQPVARHMKKVEIQEDVPEKKLLLENSNNEKKDEAITTPVIKLTDPEKMFPEQKEDPTEDVAAGNAVTRLIKNYLDWPLLKEFLMTSACYSVAVCVFTDNTYTFFLPQYLYDRHWSPDSVAWAFSLQAFGDIATRAVLIFSSSGVKILGSQLLYVIGVVVGILTKLALLWVHDYKASLAIITAMGISRSTITVLFPLVVSDSVRPEVFPSAMGISMLFIGLISIVMGPVTGAIRDATGDYEATFYIFISLLIAAAAAMTIEAVLRRKKQNKV